jgi:hypothetical protein
MKVSRIWACTILLANLSQAWSQSSPPPVAEVSVSDVAMAFTNYERITKNAVFVNPELAMLCRGVTQEDIDRARTKVGPHANARIVIYMNKPAAGAFAANTNEFPVGSVIVKQKADVTPLDKDGKLRTRFPITGVGGMIKRPAGYDKEHGDWEYFYFEDAAKIENGRISTCVQCHAAARDKDYVFGTWRNSAPE